MDGGAASVERVPWQDSFWRALDADDIRAGWSRHCSHPYGRRYVAAIVPWVACAEIQDRLAWSQCLSQRVTSGSPLPTPDLPDVDALLDLAQRSGAGLSGRDLRAIFSILIAQKAYAAALRQTEDFLTTLAADLDPPAMLSRSLGMALDEEGEILDTASPDLAFLRQRLRTSRGELQRFLQNVLRNPDWQEYWQDQVIVQRNDRYVLPLKASHKGRIKAIVHDRSASGETLFVEPFAAVDLNNQLVQDRCAEMREQERILRVLTAAVGEAAPGMITALRHIGRLDAVRAGLALGNAYGGILPRVDVVAAFDLHALRHPLLCLRHPGQVVGNTVRLGGAVGQLVITGPNTGGKTALLKAVGLNHLLAYMGLPVTAEGTLGYFQKCFAVIGDAQDIHADLSTFSAQVRRLIGVLEHADANSLVLLDELGNGTDPREGGALAQAVAETLLEMKACTLLTSHLEVMTRYALGREGVALAGMGFDAERLAPTYRLQWGVGGASHGLAIARREGMPASLMTRAEVLHASDREDWARWEAQREGLLLAAQRAMEEAERVGNEAARSARRLEHELEAARRERDKAATVARAEWEGILTAARQQVRETITALKSGRDTQAASATLQRLSAPFRVEEPPANGLPAVGAKGLFLPLRQVTQVLRVDPARQRVQIQLRGKQLWIPVARFAVDAALQLPKEQGGTRYATPEDHPWRLDLRGQLREDAWTALRRHVDGAVAAGRQQVDILHGKGNGVLAEMVREFAEQDPRVSQWRMARPEHGGGGVSELELR
ncbi:Smr/MutS family protein [Acidithiobacillus ferrianus]|uniref:Endonuclease MutS2 n=2 Tax=Acidithiobacillus ferrianus TaxID=2678518 RepID=A0A845U900_9PROT|nr:Smr/MutS family protein [Acidithiobacillus ferrianus]NDU43323.1 endonuclease MutS2 [Acidithiobacillus ferrianus]